MFTQSLKSILAAAVLAGGVAFTTTGTANAGGKSRIHIEFGHAGFNVGSHGFYVGNGIRGHALRYKYRNNWHRGYCHPRRVVKKAWRMGLNRPYVRRVNRNRIVVGGYSRGHSAKVVFKRNSYKCRVLKARGL